MTTGMDQAAEAIREQITRKSRAADAKCRLPPPASDLESRAGLAAREAATIWGR
jgi:hypothetical protein